MTYVCPVCGYDKMHEAPYYSNGDASFDLCLCCGFQFGVDDDVEIENGKFLTRKESHVLYRDNWIKDGAKVFSSDAFDTNLDRGESLGRELLEKQLHTIHIQLEKRMES